MAYFGITTGAADRELERIVDSVCQAFLHVANLQGIGFLNSSGKGSQITDLDNRAEDILFFTLVPPSLLTRLIRASRRQRYR